MLLLSCSVLLILTLLPRGHAAPQVVGSHKEPRHWPVPLDEHWLRQAVETAVFSTYQVSAVHAQGPDSAAFQLTGIPRKWVTAGTSSHRLTRQLLTILRFSGRLSMDNTGKWERFYEKHLEHNPSLEINMGLKDKTASLKLRLFLYKSQGHYWLQCMRQRPAGDNDYAWNDFVSQEGGAAVTLQSFRRFLQMLRASLVQRKHWKSQMTVTDMDHAS